MNVLRSKIIALPALALGLGLSALAPCAIAQQKIAVIDMQGSLLSTNEGKKAAEELKAKFSSKETEFSKRSQDLAAKQDQLRKGANTMSDAARASAEREVAALSKTLQRDTDDVKADFQAEENRLLGGILSKMQAILTKYATDNQISMIVDVSQQPNNLLYADQAANISAAVIALYDKADTPAAAPAPARPALDKPAPAKPALDKPAPAKPAAPAAAPKKQ
jgi:Skp family chaperone for outer membrane proteins